MSWIVCDEEDEMKSSARRILTLLVVIPAFLSALGGILIPHIYDGLFPKDFIPGALPQDVLTLLVCIVLLALTFSRYKDDLKANVIVIGLYGSLWYLYGIVTIERVYNWFYLLYATTFATSFWSLIYSIAAIEWRSLSCELSKPIRKLTGIASISIATLFTVVWISSLIPLMIAHDRIEFLYSIYILDLCFVMPAFFMLGVMTLKGERAGILLTPAMMILGFFVIFPLGLNEVAKGFSHLAVSAGPMVVSFGFSIFMLILAFVQLRQMRVVVDRGE